MAKPRSDETLLRFSRGNAKLSRTIAIFSIPSGFTCPGALTCLCKADESTGRLTDGPASTHRCYAATQEAAFGSVRKWRWDNFNLLRDAGGRAGMKVLLLASLRKVPHIYTVRIHGSGDFFSQPYFDAWMDVALEMPHLKFYAYTKSLKFWTKRLLDPDGGIPDNVRLTASNGGKFDHLIARHDLPKVVVVSHPEEATALGLEIDHDDSHAIHGEPAFALLLHGQQKAKSPAAKALARMREEGINYSYS